MEWTSDGVGTSTAVLLAAVSTAVLVVLHLVAPRIHRLPLVPRRATASFAGGLAVAYVFLHLLPELAQGNAELRELFGETAEPSPLLELGIFTVALVGFCLFYGLERLADERGAERPHDDELGGEAVPQRPGAAAPESSRGVFWVHLASFAVYNAVITYTLPSTYRTGVGFAVLFTLAMGLHFVLSDRGLAERYGVLFDRWRPRLVLAGALVAGWALAALAAPTRSLTVSLVLAFLAGSVLLNVFKEEVPSARRSSFPWFLVGLGLYSALLYAVTALE